MKSLVLLACTGGHLDYVGTNLASRFSQKTKGAPVMASDGTVFGRCVLGYYWSHSDDFFDNQSKEKRKCQGWAVYQSNKLGVTQVQKVNKTLKHFGEMLDDLDKYTFATISNKKSDASSKFLEGWLKY